MVASLLRVLHSGIQDSRLLPPKGKPDISLFQFVLTRAGRFTTQWVRLDFDTRPQFGAKATITLPRKGNLISRLFLVTTMPDIRTPQDVAAAAATAAGAQFAGPQFGWTNSLGHALLQQATVEIGGNRVEQIDGRLLEVLDEFRTPLEKLPLANELLGRNMTNFPQFQDVSSNTVAITPLPFWFSRGDPGVFLPIDALAVDPVRLSITFAPLNALYVSSAKDPVTLQQVSSGQQPTAQPVAGAGYFPLVGSPFYRVDPSGAPVPGLSGFPGVAGPAVSRISGVTMPTASQLPLGETYLFAEYIYLDGPEANRFRIADISVPVVQHYAFDPVDSKGTARTAIPLKIPNPARNLFFYASRYEAGTYYNAPFLATRDLSGADASGVPWWPNAARVEPRFPALLQPGFVFRDSEPLASFVFQYEGKLVRYSAESPSMFRSLLPSYEMRKSPYVNRYIYSLHFGLNHGGLPASVPSGEANLDKIVNISLNLDFKPARGCTDPNAVPRYLIYCWAETYNIFRVYGGRGGMLFGY